MYEIDLDTALELFYQNNVIGIYTVPQYSLCSNDTLCGELLVCSDDNY